MLDTLLGLIKSELGMFHMNDIVNNSLNIINLLDEEYLKDGNTRDAAIDAVCQILQSHKKNH